MRFFQQYSSATGVYIGVLIQLLMAWSVSTYIIKCTTIFPLLFYLILINAYAFYENCIARLDKDATICDVSICYKEEFDPEFMEQHLHPTWTKETSFLISNGLTLRFCDSSHTCIPQIEYSQDGNYKVTIIHSIGKQTPFFKEHRFICIYQRAQ